jgi:hypothetical protein
MKNATFTITPVFDAPDSFSYFDLTVQSVGPVEGLRPGRYKTAKEVMGAFDWDLTKESEQKILQALNLKLPFVRKFEGTFVNHF